MSRLIAPSRVVAAAVASPGVGICRAVALALVIGISLNPAPTPGTIKGFANKPLYTTYRCDILVYTP
jgi:hypothetical protein